MRIRLKDIRKEVFKNFRDGYNSIVIGGSTFIVWHSFKEPRHLGYKVLNSDRSKVLLECQSRLEVIKFIYSELKKA